MPTTQTPPTEQAKVQLAAGRDELSQQTAKASNAASDAARQASDEVGAAADRAGAALSDAAQQAKSKAGELVGSAKQEAYAKAEEAKSVVRQKVAAYTETGKQKAAGEVNTYGSAIGKAAEELEKNDDPAAPIVRAAAEKVQKFGSYLDSRNTGDLVDQAEDFARRHPEVVLGGMFVLGLGLARFFKSTREPLPVRRTQPSSTYAGSTAGGYGANYGGAYGSANRYAAPTRLSNPSPQAGRKPVTVLEETSTVVPSHPK